MLNRKKWQTGQVLETFDAFGEPVPGFNVKGQNTVTSRTGGMITLLISSVVILYAAVKFIHLYTRHNPLLSSYYQDVTANEILNLSEQKEFKIAFSIEDYNEPKKQKNNPEYVKLLLRLLEKKDGVWSDRELGTHTCTDQDYAQFYPIQEQQAVFLEEIKRDPDRGFFCLNEAEDIDVGIFGSELLDNY